MTRPSWSRYFLELARTVSTRATCPRKQVGCVLVRDRHVISSGYNGAVRGADHCPPPPPKDYCPEDEPVGGPPIDCTEGTGHCQRSVHSEVNAVAAAARFGVSVLGATAYVTVRPCVNCYRVLVNAGVVEIVYAEEYGPTEYETVEQVSMRREA